MSIFTKGKGHRDQVRKANNALQAGISAFLTSSRHNAFDVRLLPSKYVLYPPLLLLPVNFSSTTPIWQAMYEDLQKDEKDDLFSYIAAAFKSQIITNIAINAAINATAQESGTENVMRSPGGIMPVYGDFGPRWLLSPEQNHGFPTQEDFDAAFWVSAVQNHGIVQTWAPLWTMFSRGNITEKARILGEGNGMRGLTEDELDEDLSAVDVADFYVGIGYFAFSYLRRGARTVFGWEINGWSVDGLKRGCEKNGWACLIIEVNGKGEIERAELSKIVGLLKSPRQACVVFLADNESATSVLSELQKWCEELSLPHLNIRHINLGLLPTAEISWGSAVHVVRKDKIGWIHVHENVDTEDVDTKRASLSEDFGKLVPTSQGGRWDVSCCHVERVKTYAPGVMHCVFDIEIKPT